MEYVDDPTALQYLLRDALLREAQEATAIVVSVASSYTQSAAEVKRWIRRVRHV
jgi:hypothetical protein